MKRRHEQKLIILALLLLICFNLPIVLLFDSAQSLAGIPVIYFYLFSVCVFSILISLYIVNRYHE
ncbi:hypothetical protein FCR2A7T_22020 [Flavobacterium cauense R2A-7]|uniref:Uncharacterized protein n=1 Tax=Flavobacterium cauense R2A-7 TaxID=1341154 RepID=V6RXA8_9FLAO|nr:hypothetical protein [Flavobacterium cauense]ESU18799.1 hypothetical protein FCR2A7T_22020 [Flavobacterium cauense R2A-7]KGO81730.1 hypothetical protein Q762_07755 [Flavobacterium cauense R2A-7]TWI13760.1 hypothetical protein IP98_00907 [Flavobacterium cauense R2A-7]